MPAGVGLGVLEASAPWQAVTVPVGRTVRAVGLGTAVLLIGVTVGVWLDTTGLSDTDIFNLICLLGCDGLAQNRLDHRSARPAISKVDAT